MTEAGALLRRLNRRELLLPLASGLLLCFSFPNFVLRGFHWQTNLVAWVALVPLLASLEGASPRQAFGRGFLAGLVFFLCALYWINYVKPMGWGATVGWAALSAYLALYPALFAVLVRRGLDEGLRLPLLWIPALWTLLEYGRGTFFSGFPWASLGSSQYLDPLVLPLAAAAGIWGLHFLVALGNLLAFSLAGGGSWLKPSRRLAAGAALVLACLGLTAWLGRAAAEPEAPRARVAVIQGSLDQDQAWTSDYRAHLMRVYLGLMDRAADWGARTLVWPEGSFPGIFSLSPPEAGELRAFARARGVDLLVGSDNFDPSAGTYSNSVLWIAADGRLGEYKKRHLVPFGEYIPLRHVLPFLNKAVESIGFQDFTPGTRAGAFPTLAGEAGPLICYEGIFPGLCRDSVERGAEWLSISTFDTWYGNSAAPYQHVALAVFRAVEEDRWIARAGATGISCFISPKGAISDVVGLYRRGFAVRDIRLLKARTLFRRWGNWFVWACLALVLGCLALPRGAPGSGRD